MRLHLVALPHTSVEQAFCGCAYTAKILKFCKMMGSKYEIFLYAPEGPEVPGARLIPCLTETKRISIFGEDDPMRLPAWPTHDQSRIFNNNVAAALQMHSEKGELLLLTGGYTHKPITDQVHGRICIEPGVGYEGIFTNFCAFESAAWMHYVYGKKGIADGRYFDEVIPNYFDLDDFPMLPFNPDAKPYLMFLGRLIARKGLDVAALIAKKAGLPLLVAGAGGKMDNGKLIGQGVTVDGDIEYVGSVGIQKRSRLLSQATALLVPTRYIEPFGGVAVEAMLCGTPVIASDWGAFRETVTPDVGRRFRTLQEGVDAVGKVNKLDRNKIRFLAQTHYSLATVAPKFSTWFGRLETLKEKGWYTTNENSYR